MKAEHVNPFLKSAAETFKTMVNLTVKPGKPFLRKEPGGNADISCILNISGDIAGVIVMGYSTETALKICSKFLGEEIKELNASVADCIGELANIVTGFAKKDFQAQRLSISLPSIVYGQDSMASMPEGAVILCIPFESEAGSFNIEASYET
ncbi:MAG: chemotaxis protein CheX [Fibromonadaceae bacterium]|jgi:chemotaxis protein CheX|nr:chemotaxis protein CheX [Fibromonadaceae bacterium]